MPNVSNIWMAVASVAAIAIICILSLFLKALKRSSLNGCIFSILITKLKKDPRKVVMTIGAKLKEGGKREKK
jgi:hypothetical protein